MAAAGEHGAYSVLLVEDDTTTMAVVSELLKRASYTVLTATNGREAIAVLQENKVDLILTDVLMPEVNGFELIEQVCGSRKFGSVPVIVMSCQESQESVLRAFRAGASDYLIKPLRRNEVATLWQHVWRVKSAQATAERAAAAGAEAAADAEAAAEADAAAAAALNDGSCERMGSRNASTSNGGAPADTTFVQSSLRSPGGTAAAAAAAAVFARRKQQQAEAAAEEAAQAASGRVASTATAVHPRHFDGGAGPSGTGSAQPAPAAATAAAPAGAPAASSPLPPIRHKPQRGQSRLRELVVAAAAAPAPAPAPAATAMAKSEEAGAPAGEAEATAATSPGAAARRPMRPRAERSIRRRRLCAPPGRWPPAPPPPPPPPPAAACGAQRRRRRRPRRRCRRASAASSAQTSCPPARRRWRCWRCGCPCARRSRR